MPYRCQGCGEYQRDPPRRRVGLGAVCSDACAAQVAGRRQRRPGGGSRPGDTPAAARTHVLERDNGCRYCGVHVGLHVHHIVYRSEGVDHSETNLITLCARHHDLIHQDKGRWQPVLQAYISDLYGKGKKSFLFDIERRMGQ